MLREKIQYAIIIFLLGLGTSFAQHGGGGHHGNGNGWYCNPDSLTDTTVTGTVIVDSMMMMQNYYLDINNDGEADYMLNFGPWWYEPDSSNAIKTK